jgi:hypothetical protein
MDFSSIYDLLKYLYLGVLNKYQDGDKIAGCLASEDDSMFELGDIYYGNLPVNKEEILIIEILNSFRKFLYRDICNTINARAHIYEIKATDFKDSFIYDKTTKFKVYAYNFPNHIRFDVMAFLNFDYYTANFSCFFIILLILVASFLQ